MITVKADDGTYTDTRDVTIRVTDVDEEPLDDNGAEEADGLCRERHGPRGDLHAIRRQCGHGHMDPGWPDDADAFDNQHRRGAHSSRTSPDYEIPADADTDNTYMVTIDGR